MSGANLDVYAQVALVVFLIAFALIVWRIYSPRYKAIHEIAKMMPLDDEHQLMLILDYPAANADAL